MQVFHSCVKSSHRNHFSVQMCDVVNSTTGMDSNKTSHLLARASPVGGIL